MGWIRWRAEEDANDSGITWLELYLLYSRHGGNEDEEAQRMSDPLRKPAQLRTQLAEFKHLVRKIAKHAISEDDEWHLSTETARVPRLRTLAVEGRTPAVRGMPIVDEMDAKAIVMAVLAMRGADKKKHKELLHEGTLKLPVRRLPMQGLVQSWRQACGQSQKWNESHNDGAIAEEPLKTICCPRCQEEHAAKDMKLKVKFGFSNLTCKACREVTTAASWRCRCDLLWIKCGLHKHEVKWRNNKGKMHVAGRKKQVNLEKGVVKPMPVARVAVRMHEAACTGMQPLMSDLRRMRLPRGSKLAGRFPQWVRPPDH